MIIQPSVMEKMHIGYAECELIKDDGGFISACQIHYANAAFQKLMALGPMEFGADTPFDQSDWLIKCLFKMAHPARALYYPKSNTWLEMDITPLDGDATFKHFALIATDITQWYTKETTLIQRNNLYRTMLDAIPDLIFCKDLSGKYLACNQAFSDHHKKPQCEIIGKYDYEILPQKRSDNYKKQDERVLESGQESRNEDWIVMSDGRSVLYETIKTPYINARGKSSGVMCVSRDITPRYQMESELRQERDLFADGPVFTIVWANKTLWPITYVSKNSIDILGFTPQEMTHASFNYLDLIHESDKEAILREIDYYFQNGMNYFEQSYRIRTKSGTYRWFYVFTMPSKDANDVLTNIRGYMVDQTAQKEMELALAKEKMRLDNIIKGTNAGTWEWEIETGITRFNERWAQICGYSLEELEPISIKTWLDLAHPEDLAESTALIEKCFNRENDYYEFESRMRHKNGDWVWVLDRGKVTEWSSEGKALRMSGTHQDITLKKHQEAEIKASREAAEAASKAKSEFLSNMSHEIRTPLNGVIGFTELLLETPLLPNQMQYARNINTSGKALLGIIDDILDFSKIEAGKLELEIIEADIIDCFEQAIDIIKYQASAKNLELLLDLPVALPRYAYIDPIRLKQILINLLSNAVKFTQNGEVTLRVQVTHQPTNSHKAQNAVYHIAVIDTGIGISEEAQTRLFKAFSQADSSTTRRFGGTGLGLIISNLLAEKMGSSIHVTSRVDQGSRFSFDLETRLGYTKPDLKQPSDLNHHGHSPIKGILIVDDNQNNRTILEHTFDAWKIPWVSLDSGKAAVDHLKALKLSGALLAEKPLYDLAIIDYHMPEQDGLETISIIRNHLEMSKETLPIILLHSAQENVDLRHQVKALGIRFSLVKPVKLKELWAYINDIKVESHQPAISQSETPLGVSPLKALSPRILIAEDVAMNLKLITLLLTKEMPMAQIEIAEDGLRAVEIFTQALEQEKPFDLLLMDVQMPVLDGLEATKSIRRIEKDYCLNKPMTQYSPIPIIALTAGVVKDERERALAHGMDAFVPKPISKNKLFEVLSKLLLKPSRGSD